jgi:cobalt-precorrin 5A hydrolase/precorrin-3B C17-methyltransferase
MTTVTPSIFVLGASALSTARLIQTTLPGAQIFGLDGRVADVDVSYQNFGRTLRARYRSGSPIIALCAAGIVIRTLAPLLSEKGDEPPVLAVAEDGSAVVPLLGGLAGVNDMARQIAAALDVSAAITTSGELRFGTCLLNPPDGYSLDLQHGKRVVSDLLAGATLRIEGDAPWLQGAALPLADEADRCVSVSAYRTDDEHTLAIHPRVVLACVASRHALMDDALSSAFAISGLAAQSLCAIIIEGQPGEHAEIAAVAMKRGVPVRFVSSQAALPPSVHVGEELTLHVAANPAEAHAIGQPRGSLHVVGLGPGAAAFMAPTVRHVLDDAQDVLGYETYVKMAGPFRPDQCLHASDNREELQRAAHAFELAASGRRVVMVSSGDPGVFAMAAAVLEALEASSNPSWHGVDLQILPGITAAMAAASRAGAPLGHDFCLISLSDNLKPWAVIEDRLRHAAAADLVMGFYNPISKARPWQLGQALDIIREQRAPTTQVVLGRDIGRPAEALTLLTLGELTPAHVDMRTMVIIGSSQTRRFQSNGKEWVYSPRSYPAVDAR